MSTLNSAPFNTEPFNAVPLWFRANLDELRLISDVSLLAVRSVEDPTASPIGPAILDRARDRL